MLFSAKVEEIALPVEIFEDDDAVPTVEHKARRGFASFSN